MEEKALKIVVYRKPPKKSCFVMLCKDRLSGKWCFVNLTSMHVCLCRFNTIDEAIKDLGNRDDAERYSICDDMFI